MKKQCAVSFWPQYAGAPDTVFGYNGGTWSVIERHSDGRLTGLGKNRVKLTIPETQKAPVFPNRKRSNTVSSPPEMQTLSAEITNRKRSNRVSAPPMHLSYDAYLFALEASPASPVKKSPKGIKV